MKCMSYVCYSLEIFFDLLNRLKFKYVARSLRTKSRNYDELIQFLLEIDAKDFTRETFPMTHYPSDNYGIEGKCLWAPIVEHSGVKNPFLSKSIDEYLSEFTNSNVDIFFGYTNAVSLVIGNLVKYFIYFLFDRKCFQ